MPRKSVESKTKRTRRTVAAALLRAGLTQDDLNRIIDDEGMAKAMAKAGKRHCESSDKAKLKELKPKIAALAREHGLTPRRLSGLFRRK
jgi:hypothetical protein